MGSHPTIPASHPAELPAESGAPAGPEGAPPPSPQTDAAVHKAPAAGNELRGTPPARPTTTAARPVPAPPKPAQKAAAGHGPETSLPSAVEPRDHDDGSPADAGSAGETPPAMPRLKTPPLPPSRPRRPRSEQPRPLPPEEPDEPEVADDEPRFRIGLAWRLALIVLAIAGIQAAVMFVRQERDPVTIRPPDVDINKLPLRLGSWTGHDEPMDERIWRVLGAEVAVNRVYREDSGGLLAMQIGVFTTNDVVLPHEPHVCYGNVGWNKSTQKDLHLRTETQGMRTARMVTFQQEGQRIHVLYWYQFGDANVVDFDGLRRERWKLFGEKTWPPLIKVMLQSTVADPARAEQQLRSFGELVLGWTKDVK